MDFQHLQQLQLYPLNIFTSVFAIERIKESMTDISEDESYFSEDSDVNPGCYCCGNDRSHDCDCDCDGDCEFDFNDSESEATTHDYWVSWCMKRSHDPEFYHLYDKYLHTGTVSEKILCTIYDVIYSFYVNNERVDVNCFLQDLPEDCPEVIIDLVHYAWKNTDVAVSAAKKYAIEKAS